MTKTTVTKAAIQKVSMKKMGEHCERVSELLKSLSHPQRLMILGHLTQGPKTVSELQELCSISQSQLSQYLNRMRLEKLVNRTRQGKYQVYSIENQELVQLIAAIQKIFCC